MHPHGVFSRKFLCFYDSCVFLNIIVTYGVHFGIYVFSFMENQVA